MNKTTSIIVLMAGFALASASQTRAQTPLNGKAFVNINAAAQTRTDTISNGASINNVYGQTATWATTETVDGGALLDISVGYRAWRDLGVAIGFSSFNSTGSAVGSASVPSQIFFNKPNAVTLDLSTAPRTDRNVYLVAMWFYPVRDNIDVAVSIGPSFTRVRQQVVTTVTIPENTSNAVAVVGDESGTARGVNVGVDGAYMFTKLIGAGVFIRYNGGSIDLPSAPGLKVGGFQIGIGARMRF
jgi:hypothetical protein